MLLFVCSMGRRKPVLAGGQDIFTNPVGRVHPCKRQPRVSAPKSGYCCRNASPENWHHTKKETKMRSAEILVSSWTVSVSIFPLRTGYSVQGDLKIHEFQICGGPFLGVGGDW